MTRTYKISETEMNWLMSLERLRCGQYVLASRRLHGGNVRRAEESVKQLLDTHSYWQNMLDQEHDAELNVMKRKQSVVCHLGRMRSHLGA